MSKKRNVKRKHPAKGTCNNLIIISSLTPSHENLFLKCSFIEATPIDFTLEKLASMPFKWIDKNFEKYGVARCFDMDVSKETPLITCFYRSNTMIAPNPATIENVDDMIFMDIRLPEPVQPTGERLMTFFGSQFLRAIGEATQRERDYQIYMNSVCPMQLPVS